MLQATSFIETPKGLMTIGSPGGSYIISMVLLGTLNYLDGMSAAQIVTDPRFHHQYMPDVIEYETGALSPSEIAQLKAEGHTLQEGNRRWGNMQVITWDFASGNVEAASDPRGGSGLLSRVCSGGIFACSMSAFGFGLRLGLVGNRNRQLSSEIQHGQT